MVWSMDADPNPTALTAPQPSDKLDKPESQPPAEHHSVYCPNCSARLVSRKCKLICEQCGYYLSCADYY